MNRRAVFRQTDITRAIQAAQTAGLPVARTEITDDGRIVLHHAADAAPSNPYEEWKRAREAAGNRQGPQAAR